VGWRKFYNNDVCAICGATEDLVNCATPEQYVYVRACQAHKREVFRNRRQDYALANVDALMRNALVPVDYCTKTVRDWRASKATRNEIIEYSSTWPYENDLVLHGPNNTGKTHIAAALIRTGIVRHYQTRGMAFVSTWQAAVRLGDFKERNAAVAELLLPKLLVLDDISVPTNKQALEALYGVLDWRSSNRADGFRTIVTMDQAPMEAEPNLGRRIVARLLRMRRMPLVTLTAEKRQSVAESVG